MNTLQEATRTHEKDKACQLSEKDSTASDGEEGSGGQHIHRFPLRQPKMVSVLKKSGFHRISLLLLVLLAKSSHCLPPWISDCIVDGQECKLTGDNLISVTKNVTSIGECAKV